MPEEYRIWKEKVDALESKKAALAQQQSVPASTTQASKKESNAQVRVCLSRA
jgi:hypothetical protein